MSVCHWISVVSIETLFSSAENFTKRLTIEDNLVDQLGLGLELKTRNVWP